MEMNTSGGDKIKKFLDETVKSISSLKPVKIGYFHTARYPDGTNVAEVAVTHEFGNPHQTLFRNSAPIPARPTMRPAFKRLSKEMPSIVKSTAEEFMVDHPELFLSLLPERIGAKGASLIQYMIAQLKDPPLSEYTLLVRRTREVNRTDSDKPIIDTGTMRTSVSWQVGNEPIKNLQQSPL